MAPTTLLYLAALASTALAKTCPPTGWDACSTAWPPPSDGYCCSAGGWLGDTPAHCSNLNALDECCTILESGRLSCEVECADPPDVCTGDPQIDAILKTSNIGCKIGLAASNNIYSWDGFCTALTQFNSIGGSTPSFFLGDSTSSSSAAKGLANLAGLLAQAMWESGGEMPCAPPPARATTPRARR